MALGNVPNRVEQISELKHPGDKSLDNESARATKDTSRSDRKNETKAEKQRQKMS